MGGGVLAAHFVTNILFGKSGELVYNAKMVEGIASCEFPKQQSLADYNPESGTQKYFKCQTSPLYEKNKLLLAYFIISYD